MEMQIIKLLGWEYNPKKMKNRFSKNEECKIFEQFQIPLSNLEYYV